MKTPVRARNERSIRAPVSRLEHASRRDQEDQLAVEEPLEIRLGKQSVAVTMRSPGEDSELAVGFLYTEGILKGKHEIAELSRLRDPKHPHVCNVIEVTPTPGVELAQRGWQRNFVSSSSCGLCGKLTIESVRRNAPPIEDTLVVQTDIVYSLPDKLRAAQAGFDETGGLHAAGLFDADANLLLAREDIGRHNAVDKVIGAALMNDDLPLANRILMVSGRASFEIVQKALMARIPFLAAVSAASSLAVELAESSDMTLAGFVRDRSMNVYTGSGRVA